MSKLLTQFEANILEDIKNHKPTKKQSLLTQNAKMKKSGVWAWTMKASKETCPYAGSCASICYAKKAFYKMPNVKKKHLDNYELSLTTEFVPEMIKAIDAVNPKFIRIHTGGDFYSKKYIKKWIEVVNKFPNKIFYAYTKSVVLFKTLDILMPENLRIIQSLGTSNDKKFINYENTYAVIAETEEEVEKLVRLHGYLDASDNDLKALEAQVLNKNIVLKLH